MIKDAMEVFESNIDATVVVVGPTIALTTQLCNEFIEWFDRSQIHVMHVHSGHVNHYTTTDPTWIRCWIDNVRGPKLVFTSYHSLHKIQKSGAQLDTIYFDESHNSIIDFNNN